MHDTQKQWLQLGSMANRRCDAGCLLSTTSRHIPHVLFKSSRVYSGLVEPMPCNAPNIIASARVCLYTPALNGLIYSRRLRQLACLACEALSFNPMKKKYCTATHPACGRAMSILLTFSSGPIRSRNTTFCDMSSLLCVWRITTRKLGI